MGRRGTGVGWRYAAPVAAAAGLVLVAVVARSTPSHPIRNPPETTHSAPPSSPSPAFNQTRTGAHHHAAASSFNWPIAIGSALVVLALLWLFAHRKRHRWGHGVRVVHHARKRDPGGALVMAEDEHLDTAVTAALGELDAAGTDNEAIIACWRRLVATLGEHGVHATPSETSTQLVVRALAERGVSSDALHELAALFRAARFSGRTLGEPEREAARHSLQRIRDELMAAPRGA